MTKPYEAQVRRGAAFLDKKRPRWWNGRKRKKVNLKTLDLRDCDKCVLGQVWGSKDGMDGFTRAMDDLDLWQHDGYGFATSHSGYPTLTRRWREEIENRRKEAGIS